MDTNLIIAARQGDQQAFNDLYAQVCQSAYGYAMQQLQDQARAEKVVQDSFMQALQAVNSPQDAVNFEGWMNQLVMNQCSGQMGYPQPSYSQNPQAMQDGKKGKKEKKPKKAKGNAGQMPGMQGQTGAPEKKGNNVVLIAALGAVIVVMLGVFFFKDTIVGLINPNAATEQSVDTKKTEGGKSDGGKDDSKETKADDAKAAK